MSDNNSNIDLSELTADESDLEGQAFPHFFMRKDHEQRNGRDLTNEGDSVLQKLSQSATTTTEQQFHDNEMPSSSSSLSSSSSTTSSEKNLFPSLVSNLLTLPVIGNETLNFSQFPDSNDQLIKLEHLQFIDNNGVEVAFYNDEPDKTSIGFLRFKPFVYKKPATLKYQDFCFLCIKGKFELIVNENIYHLYEGDLLSLKKGYRYSMKNLDDKISIMQIIRSKTF